MDQISTPSVTSTGATTVWANGPNAPNGQPEIAKALIELVDGTPHIELEICVHLTDGTRIEDVTDARKRGATTEIRTVSTVYHVATNDIYRLIHINIE